MVSLEHKMKGLMSIRPFAFVVSGLFPFVAAVGTSLERMERRTQLPRLEGRLTYPILFVLEKALYLDQLLLISTVKPRQYIRHLISVSCLHVPLQLLTDTGTCPALIGPGSLKSDSKMMSDTRGQTLSTLILWKREVVSL